MTLRSTPLTWSTPSTVNGTAEKTPLSFHPATKDDLVEIGTTTPDLLRRIAGKIATPNKGLACSGSGCTASGAQLSIDQLADPATLPRIGSIYQSWNVASTAYVATLHVPEAGAVLVIRAGNHVLFTASLAANTNTNAIGYASVPATGYNINRYVFSYAFGRAYTPTPAYSDQTRPTTWYGSLSTKPALPSTDIPQSIQVTALNEGLASTSPETQQQTQQLNDSQLTYLSSPVTGCGIALCVPAKITTTPVVLHPALLAKMCGGPQRKQTATAVITNAAITLSSPHLITQFGINTAGPNPHSVTGSYLAPLQANFTLQAVQGLLYQNSDAAELSPVDFIGATLQKGTDQSYGQSFTPNQLSTLWHSC